MTASPTGTSKQPVESAATGCPPVLVISADRTTRRQLFDLLDDNGYRVALSASDLVQARECLSRDREIALVLVDLKQEIPELSAFAEEIATMEGRPPVHAIGILPRGAEPNLGDWASYQGLADVLREDSGVSELNFRLQRLFRTRSDHAAGTGSATPDAGSSDGRSIIELIPDPALLLDPASMQIVAANGAFFRFTGEGEGQGRALGRNFFELDSSHDAEQLHELEQALRRDGLLKFQARLPGDTAAGHIVEASLQLGAFDGETRYLATLRDLGLYRQLEQALNLITTSFDVQLDDEKSETMLEQFAHWLKLDLLLVAFRHATDSEFEPRFLHAQEQIGSTVVGDMAAGTLGNIRNGVEVVIRDGAWRKAKPEDRFLVEHRMESFIGLPLVDSKREVTGILAAASKQHIPHWNLALRALQALAGRFALEAELRRFQSDPRTQGLYDALTQLPNRLLFEDRLRNAISEARRNGELFAVLFVDLDRFRGINDSFGHDVGDQVLRGMARRLSSSIRASDTVSRYAGDEFLVILRHVTQKENVTRIVRKLNDAASQSLKLSDGREVQLTTSIGISFYPDDGATVDELVKHADQAMYSAKSLGRNTYQSYVSEPEESQQHKMLLESKLRSAEQNDELRVYYQPQVSAETEDIIGLEALIRWEHPDMGLISPGFFIPLAEETGLIVPIGKWLMGEACRQVRAWQERFNVRLRLGVNLSALQLKQPGIVDDVARILSETGLDPQLLDLEVTESISIKDVRNLLEILEALRELGCSISIDDFGTGQSSLDYIKRFPADRIKIDQIFVRNIGVDPDDAAIVEATINMAHNLNRLVVAEGVEEEQQLEFLRHNGCEELQGFLFSRPLPAASFERLLGERERLIALERSGTA